MTIYSAPKSQLGVLQPPTNSSVESYANHMKPRRAVHCSVLPPGESNDINSGAIVTIIMMSKCAYIYILRVYSKIGVTVTVVVLHDYSLQTCRPTLRDYGHRQSKTTRHVSPGRGAR